MVRVNRRRSERRAELARAIPSEEEEDEVKGLVIFRIDIVLSKHIVHRCLFDEIDLDGRRDMLAILF